MKDRGSKLSIQDPITGQLSVLGFFLAVLLIIGLSFGPDIGGVSLTSTQDFGANSVGGEFDWGSE